MSGIREYKAVSNFPDFFHNFFVSELKRYRFGKQYIHNAENYIKEADKHISIYGRYSISQYSKTDDAVIFSTQTLESVTLADELPDNGIAALFFLTLGVDSEKREDCNEEVLFSILYSILLHYHILELRHKISAETGEDFSCHYSPGLKGWDIAENLKILSILDPLKQSAKTSSTGTIYPLNTVCGLFSQKTNTQLSCPECGMPNCFFKDMNVRINNAAFR